MSEELEKWLKMSKSPATTSMYHKAVSSRQAWLDKLDLPPSQESFVIYLAKRANSVGASALAIEAAAFRSSNYSVDPTIDCLISDIIKAKKRSDSENRSQPSMLLPEHMKSIIAKIGPDTTLKDQRDILICWISWEGLLRSSEVANLKWVDVIFSKNHTELRIRKAKNDQMALGRSTFIDNERSVSQFKPFFLSFKSRVAPKTEDDFIFTNLNNGSQLSPSAISSTTKKLFVSHQLPDNLTHHSIRRGAANFLVKSGLSTENVRNRGRWRSEGGLARYLVDQPASQGIPENH